MSSFSPYFFGLSFDAIHLRVSTRRRERAMCSPFALYPAFSGSLLAIQSFVPSSAISSVSSAR